MTSILLLTLALGTALSQTPPLQLRATMISLAVKDSVRSIPFYAETLGLQPEAALLWHHPTRLPRAPGPQHSLIPTVTC